MALVHRHQRLRQSGQKLILLQLPRSFLFLGRHLPRPHPVKHLHPAGQRSVIKMIQRQRRQVQPTLLHIAIVALEAVLIKKRRQG